MLRMYAIAGGRDTKGKTMTSPLRWTEDQGRAYETARETITHYSGLVHHELNQIESQFGDNSGAALALRAYLVDVSMERKNMNIVDDAAIAAIQAKYDALIAGMRKQAIAA